MSLSSTTHRTVAHPTIITKVPNICSILIKLHRDTFLPLRLVELTVYLIHSSSLLRASLGSDDLGFSVVSVVFAQNFYAPSNLAATFLIEVFPCK